MGLIKTNDEWHDETISNMKSKSGKALQKRA
jgi:hypothetical protein